MEGVCQYVFSRTCEEVCKVAVISGGAAMSVALAPGALAGLGFTSAGIAAGSLAAKMMGYFAVANGGGVAAGGLVAILQSLGAGGLTGTATGAAVGAGGTLGWLLSAICNQTTTNEDLQP